MTKIDVSLEPYIIQVGQNEDITLSLTNPLDKVLHNLIFRLKAEEGIQIIGNKKNYDVSEIGSGQTEMVPIRCYGKEVGTYKLSLWKISAKSAGQSLHIDKQQLEIQVVPNVVDSFKPLNLVCNTASLIQNLRCPLSITVINTSDQPVRIKDIESESADLSIDGGLQPLLPHKPVDLQLSALSKMAGKVTIPLIVRFSTDQVRIDQQKFQVHLDVKPDDRPQHQINIQTGDITQVGGIKNTVFGNLIHTGNRPDPAQEQNPKQNNPRVDFVIVTALKEEHNAVLSQLPSYHQLPPQLEDIRTYYQSDLPVKFPDGQTGRYKVVVMPLLGMGRVQAANATQDAIRLWHPRYVILTGIAGGLADREIDLGDILIADQIVDYELQKIRPEGPEVRYEIHRTDARLLNAAQNYTSLSWSSTISEKRPTSDEPGIRFGPIASGDKVVAVGELLGRYQNDWPRLNGVEMEAGGVASAAFQTATPPGFFMVRCVSDLADENKDTEEVENWRPYACQAAAAYTIGFLKSGPVPFEVEE